MKQIKRTLPWAFILAVLLAGCAASNSTLSAPESEENAMSMSTAPGVSPTILQPITKITALADDFSMVRHEKDTSFDAFLQAGGASSDEAVVQFLAQNGIFGAENLSLQADGFGCSTLSVRSPNGKMLFGRNFDWEACNALVVSAKPQNGYASVSTVNMDFLGSFVKLLPESTRTLAALYAPLDGINEQGLTVAVLMISDSATIEQNTEKPDITTTTAIRLLLQKAATVDEALALLRQYDMHASMGMMVHFALADSQGKSVVVEYVNNEMIVIETPVVTNFYLAEGNKNGVGTEESHTRFELLTERLAEAPTMDEAAVRDAMQSVSKQNFGEFESTEWSVVYDQSAGLAHYYHRENYKNVYTFSAE